MDETVEPVRKRRRSSILNRQPPDDKPPPVIVEGSEKNAYVLKIPRLDSSETQDETTLKLYIDDLEREKACWKTILDERKALKESVKKSGGTVPELSWRTAHNFLTEEDIVFLKNEPSSEKIADDFDNLVKRGAILRTKYERVNHLAASAVSLAKLRLTNIERDIAEYSDKTVDVDLRVCNS